MNGLTTTGILLGGALAIIFTLFTVMSFAGDRNKKGELVLKNSSALPRKIAGAFSGVFGAIMLGMWTYFMTQGRESFVANFWDLVAHAGTMLLSSVTLLLSSIALFRNWKRAPAMFMTSIGIMMFSILLAISAYGMMGHPFLMNGVAVVLLVVIAYFVGLVFAWEHFVLHLDEKEK